METGSEDEQIQETRLVRLLAVPMIARFVHDTSARVVYPFLPEIATGLRISVDQLGILLSLRTTSGLLSPVFGAMSDRFGHRRMMVAGLVVLASGSGLLSIVDSVVGAALAFIVIGMGFAIYLPTQQAYVSERVPYERRGRALGAIELTWAAAGAIGVPLTGALIVPLGWRAPFLALAVATLLVAALTLTLPETPRVKRTQGKSIKWRLILRNRSAMVMLVAWFLILFASESVQIGYASWLASEFGLGIAERGNVAILLGLFEVGAELVVVLFVDRIGKKRSVSIALIVSFLGYVLLSSIAPLTLWLALISLGIATFGFEFSVVAGIPIISEQVPQARGSMLAMGVMAGGLGRSVGALSGSALLKGVGFASVAAVSSVVTILILLLFVKGVHE